MKITEAAKTLSKLSEQLGAEIAFRESGGIDMYWLNVRLQPEVKDLAKVVDAINTLKELGAESA